MRTAISNAGKGEGEERDICIQTLDQKVMIYVCIKAFFWGGLGEVKGLHPGPEGDDAMMILWYWIAVCSYLCVKVYV